ncbi:hypothetical protein AYO21_12225 [Fonsecaea monophora]|uniref:EthD domain-containing protein n=2 Tax=Fonsecaea TaxID=40354 RepID=A0A0D2ESB6_9EURO|nr:uncharacterized protein Z517_09578 [Fonsecaea pedrosoi CBS 271.37]XP_022505714.1 hypothetical protein AYO21_12225 [Fonsecaea monophora]KAH0829724.1 ethyl tert-butyl ether degradation EthD [Fonsecaea pedrosoi]KIW77132.1 hypothetical protein Z517_09578 [Fonsecaea pedrosoi CBS 271.37]OAG33762.1 hypothetical protein AYO21_12225 [Fonsecaea monophora]
MVYRVINLVYRSPNMTPEQFRHHYETVHAPLAVECTDPRNAPLSYTRRYVVDTGARPRGIAAPDFDCIAELTFRDEATWLRYLEGLTTGENGKRIAEDSLIFQRAAEAKLSAMELEETTVLSAETS